MSEVKTRPEEYTRGKPMPPQGTAGGYDQNWYPIALSRDVKAGEVHGTEFLNGKVIVVRDPSAASIGQPLDGISAERAAALDARRSAQRVKASGKWRR